MTGNREVVLAAEAHVEQVLRLEADRDAWASKRPMWRIYVGCVVGAFAGSALFPFARGVLLGFVVAGTLFVPTQLLVRRIQLKDIDRRLKKLRDGAGRSLVGGIGPGEEDGEARPM